MFSSFIHAAELGIAAGYSFNYRIPRVDMDYSDNSLQYTGPLYVYIDLFSARFLNARIETGWCQILDEEIIIDPNTEGDLFVNQKRRHYFSLSPLAKINDTFPPFEVFGTAGLKFDILVETEQVSESTVLQENTGNGSRSAVLFGMRAGGGMDFPIKNWRLGVSADIETNISSITHDNAYRQIIVSLRLNIGYSGLFLSNRASSSE